MDAVLHPAPSGLRPWYERGPDGVWTGRAWVDENRARSETAAPGCSVHFDLFTTIGRGSLWTQVGYAPVKVRRWKPRGFGGTR